MARRVRLSSVAFLSPAGMWASTTMFVLSSRIAVVTGRSAALTQPADAK
jgi:hypothetical protein